MTAQCPLWSCKQLSDAEAAPRSTHTTSNLIEISGKLMFFFWTKCLCAEEGSKPNTSPGKWWNPSFSTQCGRQGTWECHQTESTRLLDVLIMNRAEEKRRQCNWKERFQLMLMIIMLPAAAELCFWLEQSILPSVSSLAAKPHSGCYSYATPEWGQIIVEYASRS